MTTKVANGLDLQSQKIITVLDPTNAQDAATKNYVDTNKAGFYYVPAGAVEIIPVNRLVDTYFHTTIDGRIIINGIMRCG